MPLRLNCAAGMILPGIRRFRVGIGDGAYAAVKDVRRVEQFAEVALPHSHRWNQGCRVLLLAASRPFLRPEEEEFAPVGVELSWDEHRAADVVAELVEAERRRTAGFAWLFGL